MFGGMFASQNGALGGGMFESQRRAPAPFGLGMFIDFTTGSPNLPSGLTFTRNSNRLQWDVASGQYVAKPANVYAPDYDPLTGACRGFRSETAATNLLVRSSDFAHSSWTASNLTKNGNVPGIIAGYSAQSVTSSNPSGQLALGTGAFSGFSDTLYAIIEQGNGTSCAISQYNNAAVGHAALAQLIFATGATAIIVGSGTAGAIKLRDAGPNGGKVYLLWVTTSATAGNGRTIFLYPCYPSASATAYVHHAQLVSGTRVSSPIVTGAATAARAADVMSMLTLPPWFDQSKYTMFAEVELEQAVAADGRILTLSDGTSANRDMLYATGSAQFNRLVTVASVTNASTSAAGNATGITRMAASLTTNQARHAVKGTATIEDSSVSMPAVSQVHVGHFMSVLQLDGWIRRIGIAPITRTTAELQAMTV